MNPSRKIKQISIVMEDLDCKMETLSTKLKSKLASNKFPPHLTFACPQAKEEILKQKLKCKTEIDST